MHLSPKRNLVRLNTVIQCRYKSCSCAQNQADEHLKPSKEDKVCFSVTRLNIEHGVAYQSDITLVKISSSGGGFNSYE